MEAEICDLKVQLQEARKEIEKQQLAYAALEQKVVSKFGCRYTGDEADQVKKAARTLLRYEEAKDNISAVKTKKNNQAVQRFAAEYGETWNTVLRKKSKDAEQLKAENARLNKEARDYNYHIRLLQNKVHSCSILALSCPGVPCLRQHSTVITTP